MLLASLDVLFLVLDVSGNSIFFLVGIAQLPGYQVEGVAPCRAVGVFARLWRGFRWLVSVLLVHDVGVRCSRFDEKVLSWACKLR